MSDISQLPSTVEWLHEPELEEGMDLEGQDAVVNFWMPWADRTDFLEVVGGLPETFSAGGVSYTRIVPLAYPAFDNCYAHRVRLKGGGASREPTPITLGIEYDWAFATVWFRTPKWNIGGDWPMITWQQETAAEYVTRPGTAYVFPSDSSQLQQNAAVRVSVADIVLTFHQLNNFDQSLYDGLTGCVNEFTFLGKDPGTVMYVGPSTAGEQRTGNQTTFTISHKFRWRSVAHNLIMRHDGADFEAPVDGNGDFFYTIADLNTIFA